MDITYYIRKKVDYLLKRTLDIKGKVKGLKSFKFNMSSYIGGFQWIMHQLKQTSFKYLKWFNWKNQENKHTEVHGKVKGYLKCQFCFWATCLCLSGVIKRINLEAREELNIHLHKTMTMLVYVKECNKLRMYLVMHGIVITI